MMRQKLQLHLTSRPSAVFRAPQHPLLLGRKACKGLQRVANKQWKRNKLHMDKAKHGPREKLSRVGHKVPKLGTGLARRVVWRCIYFLGGGPG